MSDELDRKALEQMYYACKVAIEELTKCLKILGAEGETLHQNVAVAWLNRGIAAAKDAEVRDIDRIA